MTKIIKTILLENHGLATQDIKNWVSNHDDQYKEVNPDISRYYSISSDLWTFAMLINPDLSALFTSSSFESGVSLDAYKRFNREWSTEFNHLGFYQIEYYAWIIREAVSYREAHKIQPLELHLNYYGVDFLKSVNDLKWNEGTKDWIKLLLRQFEGHFKLHLYSDFKLVKTVTNEEELGFTYE